VPTQGPFAIAAGRTLDRQGLQILRLNDGRAAIVDASLASQGMATATTTDSVELSWDRNPRATGYTILRDGARIADVSPQAGSFSDSGVAPGASHRYVVVPTLLGAPTESDRMWSVTTTVPGRDLRVGETTALVRQGVMDATVAATASTTTLSWITFIPQARIDAPPSAGICEYGTGYQYGGDGHAAYDWTTSRYRTALHATITWSTKAVVSNKAVGASHVYKKSTGTLVATKVASTSGMSVKRLGSGSNSVDVRMVTHASNPFCKAAAGAIDGAFTMHLTQSGNYSISSGSHRQMPNHYIYIYNGGHVTDVYKRGYSSAWCLDSEWLCQLANITGYYGSFR
jgi:hypothetical protein